MSRPKILHIETSTHICSVALSEGGQLSAERESSEDRSHGTLLTLFINEVLEESGNKPTDIDAIAVSKGPGSYTGLRIGVSAAKGFAYGANIPVIGIISLQAMAIGALTDPKINKLLSANRNTLLCPMIDARRMEVFSAIYNSDFQQQRKVEAQILDENSLLEFSRENPLILFGTGSDKAKGLIKHKNVHIIPGINASAKHMIPLASLAFNKKEFEDTAYFEPFYLKDFVATIPKKKVL